MANLSVINALLIASSERFSIAWNPVFVFRYRCFDGQFPGFGEYIISPNFGIALLWFCLVIILKGLVNLI